MFGSMQIMKEEISEQNVHNNKPVRFAWARDFIVKYEHQLPFLFFVTGFVWDSLTLTRIDLFLDQLILFSHLAIAGMGIFLLNLHSAGKIHFEPLASRGKWIPYLIQFSFGALFSGYVIFYTKSAALLTAWPFLVMLVALLLGNEYFKGRYERFTFHMSIYFVVLFSFLIFQVPIFLGRIGVDVFFISGAIAIILMWLFIKGIAYFVPERVASRKKYLWMSIASLYAVFNILYFTNVIPPIPLSMKEIGIYHLVEKQTDGTYMLSYEQSAWWEFWRKSNQVFHREEGAGLYCFASVFAPTRLNTDIVHHWQYFSESEGKWISKGKIGYPISGGSDTGYRRLMKYIMGKAIDFRSHDWHKPRLSRLMLVHGVFSIIAVVILVGAMFCWFRTAVTNR